MSEKESIEDRLRKQILSRLEDLKKKIETNESCPEMEQDVHLLVGIDDYIENCLTAWYY